MPIGIAIGASTAISAGASIIGANKQKKASERAITAQTEASGNSDRIALQISQEQAARNEPFRQLGLASINPYADLLGLDYQYGGAGGGASQQPTNGFLAQHLRSQSGGQGRPQRGYAGGGGGRERGGNAFNNVARRAVYGADPTNYRGSFGVPGGINYEPDDYEFAGGRRFDPYYAGGGQGQDGGFAYGTGQVLPPQNGFNAAPTQQERTASAQEALENRPGFQFRVRQGVKALDNSAAARGMTQSGAQIKAALQYGQDYGSNEYDKELNRLSVARGGGQTATRDTNQAAAQYGATAASNAFNLGNARASAYNRQGQASADAISGVADAAGRGVNAYGQYDGWWG